MKATQVLAGATCFIVACVLAVELVLGSAGADQIISGLLAISFFCLGVFALWDVLRYEEKSWVEDLTLAHLKDIHKRK